MSHLAGPIVDASDDGGGNGGAARRDHGGTPVEATAKHKRARTSFRGSGEPITEGCTVYGGGRCPSHGDGHGRDASAS